MCMCITFTRDNLHENPDEENSWPQTADDKKWSSAIVFMLLCSQSSDLSVVLHSGSYSVVFSCHYYPDCTAAEATVVTNEWKEACYSLYKIYEADVTKLHKGGSS